MACTCTPIQDGYPVNNIPVKIGAPLSTACERMTTIGAIPSVLNYAGFTLVGGAPVTRIASMGGIEYPSCFFATRSGCYESMWARPYGSTCA